MSPVSKQKLQSLKPASETLQTKYREDLELFSVLKVVSTYPPLIINNSSLVSFLKMTMHPLVLLSTVKCQWAQILGKVILANFICAFNSFRTFHIFHSLYPKIHIWEQQSPNKLLKNQTLTLILHPNSIKIIRIIIHKTHDQQRNRS